MKRLQRRENTKIEKCFNDEQLEKRLKEYALRNQSRIDRSASENHVVVAQKMEESRQRIDKFTQEKQIELRRVLKLYIEQNDYSNIDDNESD